MLLADYKANDKLFYLNFLEETPTPGLFGYRGDLVLIPGEITDERGNRKPPQLIVREAVILADEKIHMLLGGLDDIASLPTLLEVYESDFDADIRVMLFVVNLSTEMQIQVGNAAIQLIPLVQGVPWNESMELLALEKGDFKGQKPAEKLVTLYHELKSFQSGYPLVDMETALASTTSARRETFGAV